MLEVEVRKRWPGFLLDARFAAPSDGVTALFGPSGAGKTTLVHALAGLVRPDAGRIALDGAPLFDSDAGVDRPPERRRIGYVFQEARLFPHRSVRGNLRYGLARTPRRERRVDFDAVVELLGLAPLLERRPGTLSGGEKQRVALGRALLASPRLLLLDEPLAGLDAPRKAEILPYVARLREALRVPVVYVSHAADEVLRLADTVILLGGGRVVAAGAPEEILSGPERVAEEGLGTGAVLSARMKGRDADGLAELEVAGATLRLPAVEVAECARLRLRVRARDVAVARRRPEQTSIVNVLPARVASVAAGEGPHADVELRLGESAEGAALWARITRRSLRELALEPGDRVYALVKGVSLAPEEGAAPGG